MKPLSGSAINAVARPKQIVNDKILSSFRYTDDEKGVNVKKIFAETALHLDGLLPDGPEKEQAIAKLLESRVAALRAFL